MASYELTNKAVEDLNRIWEYTYDTWSEYQADKYYDLLLNSCQDIANNPDLGKNYVGINIKLFGLKVNRHIIFYRKSNNNPIEITRILHEQMDLKNRIAE
ncbi:type II toxin-antitoxin system RelE/ParE family toxin [Carboxylicivirga mesophila]|uniref:Toxin n=1 Tax=Carboxylicivirga mesophila TaxID=1166478 RepID=A0ABS5KCJ9_9BACT|nr:type II toxin-antitoxin system RelE/ParE family toxin [Carboxylicivirga mesophila]MBS2212721.1 type II toxin-antitoxin system RelE/ParE family toxin [Carboxylicivirga mesophila]